MFQSYPFHKMATDCKDYDFSHLEPHWQSFWEKSGAFRARADSGRPKYYVLDMFPYPSGAGLHMGHCENYTISDIVARYRRACGCSVLYPIGWDAFGLPTENYAVKTGRHPADVTRENISTFRRQLKALGISYDFEREVDTTDPDYFRWTQWIWLQLFRRGLAYVEEKPVWWCPALGTVLANEEVIDGKSEVGGHPVERRPLRQWVLRITAYAERLLAGLNDLDWPDSTKRMQAAWIGRSEGSEVAFDLEDLPGERLRIFTTRVDTLYGATYMVIAPEHPLAEKLTRPERREALQAYLRATASKSDLERTDLAKEKTGEFTGSHAINPVNGQRLPIWVADYVLASYGTGAIMAVPAHDERDHEFASRFGLPIPQVIAPADGSPVTLPFVDKGTDVVLVNSGDCTGLTPAEAKARLDSRFEAEGRGKGTVQFKLRDWLFSRQRYWGEPFPIFWVSEEDYTSAAGANPTLPLPAEPVSCFIEGELRFALPAPEGSLPVKLPEVSNYQPAGNGESPLSLVTDWLEIWYQPASGGAAPASGPRPGPDWIRARRETNTMPQWAGSCWYYLRFTDPHNPGALASPEALSYWGMPDLYIGGAEHAVLHLLYARFWHMVLHDLGVVPAAEPFRRLFHQGIILGEDGEKMSKSRGNVANPETIIESHGTDTLRLYLMFLGPPEASKPWNPRGIEGVHRFLHKVWRECIAEDGSIQSRISDSAKESAAFVRLHHETIRKVGEDIEHLRLNTAISQMMIFANALQKEPVARRETVRQFVQLLAPFAPHISEELWARLGGSGSVGAAAWPSYDPEVLKTSEVRLVLQVNGRHRGDQLVAQGLSEPEALEVAHGHPKVGPMLAGKAVKRVIYIPNKIINIVLEA
jgi:leucyl-tRNA synthetase